MEKLLWLDMEMTGLDVSKEVPIEVAAIVTDLEFKELEQFHAVIKQPQALLDGMDDWNTTHHGASGLTAQVPLGSEPSLVETQLIQLVDRHYLGERPVLAGNSIGQDRLFINKYFPTLAAKLHYRMLDVTAWKILLNEKFNIQYEKKNAHRAVDDIRESIAEMAFYLSFIKVPVD
jgi:oligoribonuclease